MNLFGKRHKQWKQPPEMQIDPTRTYHAVLDTNKGEIEIALLAKEAPKTVNNFVFLAREGFYDGVPFHRVLSGFMVQTGDPTGTGSGGPGYRFEDELPKPGRYEIGSVAMANAGPDTNGSQFFIVSGPSGVGLPPQYSLFGKVVSGLDVVSAIEAVGSPGAGTPRERVVIESVTISES